MFQDGYVNDLRVEWANYMAGFRAKCDMKKRSCQIDVGDIVLTLPICWEVCPVCRGNGSHVNPSIDAGGISSSDPFWEDDLGEDGESLYFSGAYDVTCYTCNGDRVVPAIDRDSADPDDLAAMDRWEAEIAHAEAVSRAEMRFGL